MDECNYITLRHSEHGYVVQCSSCESYLMAFGNVQLHLSLEEFVALKDYVASKYAKLAPPCVSEQKNIFICTDSQKVSMVFSEVELKAFNELIQQAWLKHHLNLAIKHLN